MKYKREIARRMIPAFIVILTTVLVSMAVYHKTMEKAEDKCWDGLNSVTRSVAKEIEKCFEYNLNLLDMVAEVVILKTDLEQRENVIRYLETIQNKTIFNRIDIIYPDSEVLLQTGEYVLGGNGLSFEELIKNGSFLSRRFTDPQTGKEALFYFTPIVIADKVEAVLIGSVDCETLGNLFLAEYYDDEAQVFLVDLRDGNFLIDKWHSALGNLYDLGTRETTEEYEGIDIISEVMSGKNAQVAFISRTNGAVSYMNYIPLEKFPFSVSLFVQEDVVFKDVNALKDTFVVAAHVEYFLLLIYFGWNIYAVLSAVKSQERMRQAEVEREKTEAKTRFLSSVSHDIRTPINGIIGMLNVLRLNGGIPEHMKDPLRKIDVSAKYLLTLVNDVLDMNEIESGKIVFENEPINLYEVADNLEIIMRQRANERGVDYRIDTVKLQNPYVLGSGVHLNKILMNLVSNAIKYTNEGGGVWISMENSPVVDGKAVYTFNVRDTGIGMTEAFQKNMFAAFEQEHAGARTGQVGHGLGLSIVKRLVDKMEGEIVVDSEKDVGTAFQVTIPFPVDLDRKEESKKNEEKTGLSDLSGARILLVEDNELNMEIADVVLSRAGAMITQAKNGKIAVELFEKAQPYDFDVILMDVRMPEMNGHEATRAIRAMNRPDAKKIPIIAMTAGTFTEDVKMCLDAGMDEHISKPLDMSVVIAKTAKHLERFRAGK